ncbi:MAG: thioredoxin-like domain-containing protein [Opitutaceae bacterium]
MKTSILFAAASVIASATFAQELTLAELSRRPELLPTQITLKQPVKLQGRPAMNAGQKLTVVSVRGMNVEVETPDGRSTFSTKADDTDVLAAAQDTWKKLTSEQRALTYAALLQRKDLWTYRVKLTQPQQLSGGELKAGESAILVGVEGNDLLLAYEKGNFLFNAEPRATNLLESARKLLVDKNAFPARVVEDLQGKLVDPLSGAAVTMPDQAAPKYFAFYRGAGWCGPCRQFSPSLVKFYKEMKPKHSNFEVYFISGDKTPAEMRSYAKEAGFSWGSVPQARQPQMQIVNRLFTNLIPQFVVTDGQGNVLIDSAKTGGPAVALKQFDALVKKG